jgi:hypothetical protein
VTTLADAVGGTVNRLLAATGFLVARAAPGQAESWRASIGGPYRSDRAVIRKAAASGLSVGDYLESEWGRAGRSLSIVGRMRQAGAIPDTLQTVCEIGPGSGRYVQRIQEIVSPGRYEIYEIERNRARWLARTYGVIARATDGERLAATQDSSVQLVHAHGVFASLKVIACLAYFREIARVSAPGGYAVFDIMCEECLPDDEIDEWLRTPLRYVNFLPKAFVIGFFERNGFKLIEAFSHPLMIYGQSVYLIFQKTGS